MDRILSAIERRRRVIPVGGPISRFVGATVVALALALAAGSCTAVRDLGDRMRADDGRAPVFSNEPEIRVRVHKGSEVARFDGSAKFVVRPIGGGRSQIVPGPLSVSPGAGGMSITDGAKKPVTVPAGTDVEILAYDGPNQVPTERAPRSAVSTVKPGGTARDGYIGGGSVLGMPEMKIDGVTYPGFATLRTATGDGPGRFDVIVAMPLEDYLPGVVAHEMFPRWPLRAYEIQAVCARSYAMHERDRSRRAGKTYDVEATINDQVYGGAALQQPIQDAVRNTRGLVVTDGGDVLRAYFSSTCGGRASSASEVWPATGVNSFNAAPALRGEARDVYCEASPWYRWNVTRGDEELSQRLRAWGRSAGHEVKTMTRLRHAEVADTNAAGRPVKYTLTDDRGNHYDIGAEDFRNACNFAVESLPAITRENRVNSGDVTVDIRGGYAHLRGRGLGHAVGMCQWCAKGMADRNLRVDAAVAQFYPGAKVQKLY